MIHAMRVSLGLLATILLTTGIHPSPCRSTRSIPGAAGQHRPDAPALGQDRAALEHLKRFTG
jgi:hypothetical protein